jgi:hypothetical protein
MSPPCPFTAHIAAPPLNSDTAALTAQNCAKKTDMLGTHGAFSSQAPQEFDLGQLFPTDERHLLLFH